MRRALVRVLMVLAALTWADDSMAKKRRAEKVRSQPVAIAPVPRVPVLIPAAQPLVYLVRDEIAQRKKRKPDDMTLQWLDQLAAYYGQPETTLTWVDLNGLLPRATAVIEEMGRAGDYGLDPGQFVVPELSAAPASARELAIAEAGVALAAAKYAWYARGGPIDPSQLSLWLDQSPRPVDAAKLVGLLREAGDAAEELRAFQPKHPQFEYLRRAYHAARQPLPATANKGAAGVNKAWLTKLKINMERWRWLPRDFGSLHIWNNLPEFETRVVKDGDVIHRERIIIGALTTQTPVFTGWMTHAIFHPEWGVPESIKISSLLARLRSGDTRVLNRRNMRIFDGKKEISPKSIKWAEVNIRDVPIQQRSGEDNPLGQLKFMFPNKHDVYMHDTPGKHLFANAVRTFSHGCIRVKNPQRLAEVLLGEVKGWGPADVRWQMRQKTARLEFGRAIPVHNTYFTIVADAAGNLVSLPDIYGHDRRIADAMAGVPAKQIAASDPALAQKKKNEDLVKAADATAAATALTAAGGALTTTATKPAASSASSKGFSLFWYSPPAPVKAVPPRLARRKTAGR